MYVGLGRYLIEGSKSGRESQMFKFKNFVVMIYERDFKIQYKLFSPRFVTS